MRFSKMFPGYFALITLLQVSFALAAEKPNIIVIIADDLGYGDLSCYGATEIQTPAIDQLAQEGIRFKSGYCSASTCTPTRFSLLTGTYAFRQKGTGIAPPNGPAIISPGMETLPAMLKRAGYATAAIGKWHLGLGDPAPDWNGELRPGPLDIGFDHCLLLPQRMIEYLKSMSKIVVSKTLIHPILYGLAINSLLQIIRRGSRIARR